VCVQSFTFLAAAPGPLQSRGSLIRIKSPALAVCPCCLGRKARILSQSCWPQHGLRGRQRLNFQRDAASSIMICAVARTRVRPLSDMSVSGRVSICRQTWDAHTSGPIIRIRPQQNRRGPSLEFPNETASFTALLVQWMSRGLGFYRRIGWLSWWMLIRRNRENATLFRRRIDMCW